MSAPGPHILVTGSPRSGTTFVGKMLSLPRTVGYIHEPFNPQVGINSNPIAFPYVSATRPKPAYQAMVNDLLAGRSQYRHPTTEPSRRLYKRLAKQWLKSRYAVQYKLVTHNPLVKRYLIKDPHACFLAEWLQRDFAIQTVVLWRHPAAVVASHQRLNWPFSLSSFQNQTDLIAQQLPDFKHLNGAKMTAIERWSYLWLGCYRVLDRFAAANPSMLVVRHEDLSNQPDRHFKQLYDKLDLDYSAKIKNAITAHTSAANPVAPTDNAAHVLHRDSRANIKRWHDLLDAKEIATVKRITGDLAKKYYPASDW